MSIVFPQNGGSFQFTMLVITRGMGSSQQPGSGRAGQGRLGGFSGDKLFNGLTKKGTSIFP